jgi:hypothetical protein
MSAVADKSSLRGVRIALSLRRRSGACALM